MMRKMIWLGLLALVACDQNNGMDPNYALDGRPHGSAAEAPSSYADYRQARELALMGLASVPEAIPRTQPVVAPAPAAIQPRSAASASVAVSDPVATLTRYAQTVNHPTGTTVWPRTNADPAAAARACAKYPNANNAQFAFLASGGPAKDPAQMDPDGDGFVCGWNPEPWRAASKL